MKNSDFCWLEIQDGLFEYGVRFDKDNLLSDVILRDVFGTVSAYRLTPFSNPDRLTCFYRAYGFVGVAYDIREAKNAVEKIVEKYYNESL